MAAGAAAAELNRMHRRVAQESPHQHVDGLVQGGGEQHPLALPRGGLHQPPHHRQESEVGHVVGLVDHADFHVAQVAVPLLDEVGQPPRARDDDVHPVAQRGYLRILPDAAEDGRRRQVHRRGQRRDHGVDLAGQFPGRYQDEAPGVAGEGVPVGQAGHERDREPERLAGTGPAAAQDVQPGQRVGQGGGLDRERRADARPGQDADQRRRHAKIGERSVHRTSGMRFINRQSCHTGNVSRTRVAALRAATSVETSSLTERRTTGAP